MLVLYASPIKGVTRAGKKVNDDFVSIRWRCGNLWAPDIVNRTGICLPSYRCDVEGVKTRESAGIADAASRGLRIDSSDSHWE